MKPNAPRKNSRERTISGNPFVVSVSFGASCGLQQRLTPAVLDGFHDWHPSGLGEQNRLHIYRREMNSKYKLPLVV